MTPEYTTPLHNDTQSTINYEYDIWGFMKAFIWFETY
jgi:hypothetical protein